MSEGKRYDLTGDAGPVKNCGTCMYFGDVVDVVDEDGEDYETKYHQCDKVQMYDHDSKQDGESALVKDGSGYFAALIVDSDFGCVLWREK